MLISFTVCIKNVYVTHVQNFRISDAKFEMKKFEQLVHYLHSHFELEENDSFDHICTQTIEKIRIRYLGTSLDSILSEASDAYQRVRNSIVLNDDMTIKVFTAQLSLQTSIMITKIFAEINPMDYVAKYRLKVQYIEEDVKMYDALLGAYFFHGLVFGNYPHYGSIEKPSQAVFNKIEKESGLLKVHPHCGVLMELRQSTAEIVSRYKLGNSFRPEEPTYNSFANVSRNRNIILRCINFIIFI